MSDNTKNTHKGFGLVEVLVASVIIGTALVALAAAGQLAFRSISKSAEQLQARFLAEEGLEVVRIMRDESWSDNIASREIDVAYYPVFATSTSDWSLTDTEQPLIDNTFERTVIFDEVYRRDSDDDIVPASSADEKTIDQGTRKVTSRVLWEQATGTMSVEVETYITNLFGN